MSTGSAGTISSFMVRALRWQTHVLICIVVALISRCGWTEDIQMLRMEWSLEVSAVTGTITAAMSNPILLKSKPVQEVIMSTSFWGQLTAIWHTVQVSIFCIHPCMCLCNVIFMTILWSMSFWLTVEVNTLTCLLYFCICVLCVY